MSTREEYIQKNKEAWDEKTDHHFKSAFYDVEGFVKGRNSLNEIELRLLGDVKGLSILHLQCHFGQDTLSLARMGAVVTGVDLSEKAIAKANELAERIDVKANFVCSNVYDLPAVHQHTYDIVFSSYGTIGWLPDLDRWAGVVASSLKPGGKFVFVEFHPVIWMFNEDFSRIEYTYAKSEPIVEILEGTYADKTAAIRTETITWNHSLGEVLTALIAKGLEITSFNEYDYAPYDCFQGCEAFEPGKYRIKAFGNKIPMAYSLSAIRK